MQLERGIPEKDIDDTLTFLLESGFIHLQGGATVRYAGTKLGQACCAASVDPDVALEMYSELSSAYFREQSLLQHELHLMYLILLPVPAKDLLKTDGLTYLDLWDSLGEDMKQVGTTFGLDKGCIVTASTGSLSLSLAWLVSTRGSTLPLRFMTFTRKRRTIRVLLTSFVLTSQHCGGFTLKSAHLLVWWLYFAGSLAGPNLCRCSDNSRATTIWM